MLLNRDFKRLGDLAAGTLVVYRDQQRNRYRAAFEGVQKPPFELDEAERSAILAFAERSDELSPARRIELAELLSESTGVRGHQAVETLYGYANWILQGNLSQAQGGH
jgi:hypothetical protein